MPLNRGSLVHLNKPLLNMPNTHNGRGNYATRPGGKAIPSALPKVLDWILCHADAGGFVLVSVEQLGRQETAVNSISNVLRIRRCADRRQPRLQSGDA